MQELSRRSFFGVVIGFLFQILHPLSLQIKVASVSETDLRQQEKIRRLIAARSKDLAEESDLAQRKMIAYRIERGREHLQAHNYGAAIHVLGWGGSC